MSDENKDETLEVLKLLVDKIQKLEETVYNNDNVLMKAGLVKVDSPTPQMGGGDGIIPDSKSNVFIASLIQTDSLISI